MAGLFAVIVVFYCEDSNAGVRGEFIVVKCGPGNIIFIGRRSGWVLG